MIIRIGALVIARTAASVRSAMASEPLSDEDDAVVTDVNGDVLPPLRRLTQTFLPNLNGVELLRHTRSRVAKMKIRAVEDQPRRASIFGRKFSVDSWSPRRHKPS
jgi:hypothetical protein